MDLERFSICLQSAITLQQAGFFFEEGGCFGMAYSLHQFFLKHGYQTRIHCSGSPFVHAWISFSDGTCFDHQGLMMSPPLTSDIVDLTNLMLFSQSYGHSEEHWWDSVYAAEEVLSSAEQLYVANLSMPSPGMQF